MSYSGNNISWPVSISDVQHVTGNNSSELKSLCGDNNNNVNKWARYKPERVTGHLPINYYRRKTNHFSLEVPYCINWPDRWTENVMNGPVADILYENYTPWEYLKPRGATNQGNEFYRLSDFSCLYDDNTDPYYSAQTPNRRGYNHGAEIPFVTWLDMKTGYKREENVPFDTITISRYTFNISYANNIVISFANESRGDELKLTDFIDINDSAQETDVAWRPVVQVFKQDPVGGVSWDNRPSPDWSFYGNVIKTNQNEKWTIQIPLNTFAISTGPGVGQTYYHMCVGIGCVNNDGTSWKGHSASEPSEALFLPPFTDEQASKNDYPFHYYFWVVDYDTRDINFNYLVWYGGSGDVLNESYNQQFNLTRASGTAYLTFTVTRIEGQKIHFVDNTMEPDSGYTSFKIKLVDSQSNEFILQPETASQQSNAYADHTSHRNTSAKVEEWAEGEPGETTLYALWNVELNNYSGYNAFRVYTQTGTSGTWTDNGVLEIRNN